MKVITIVNGSIELRLAPETPLEEAILTQVLHSVTLGKKVTVSGTSQEIVVTSEY